MSEQYLTRKKLYLLLLAKIVGLVQRLDNSSVQLCVFRTFCVSRHPYKEQGLGGSRTHNMVCNGAAAPYNVNIT